MSKKKSKEKVVEYSKLEHKVAAVWTRVSTGKQADNNGSLESQKRICDEYAASKGIPKICFYADTFTSSIFIKKEFVMNMLLVKVSA